MAEKEIGGGLLAGPQGDGGEGRWVCQEQQTVTNDGKSERRPPPPAERRPGI